MNKCTRWTVLCRKTTLWRIRHIYSAYELSAGVRVGLDYLIIIFRHRPCHRRNCCCHQHCDCVFVYLGWREFKCRSRSWDSHLAILPSCIFLKLLLLLWLVMPTTTTSATAAPQLPLLCHCYHYCATAAITVPLLPLLCHCYHYCATAAITVPLLPLLCHCCLTQTLCFFTQADCCTRFASQHLSAQMQQEKVQFQSRPG